MRRSVFVTHRMPRKIERRFVSGCVTKWKTPTMAFGRRDSDSIVRIELLPSEECASIKQLFDFRMRESFGWETVRDKCEGKNLFLSAGLLRINGVSRRGNLKRDT